jgi:cytochrome d ubiquinol oxidase subunit II
MLDGFDLGVGIISLFCRDEDRRSILMGSIGHVWEANQTWLVVLGGVLFGAFPMAYGVVLSGLYIPILIMLFALIFRAVSFEFRALARRKTPWNLAFGLGSLLVVLAQGFVLGALLQGLKVENDLFAGGVGDWLTPFGLLAALGLVGADVLLGATYLIVKTAGDLQRDGYRLGLWAAVLVGCLAVALGAWEILQYPFLAQRWFAWPGFLFTLVPLLLALLSFVRLIVSLLRRYEKAPFAWSLALFFFAFGSLSASLYPYLILPGVTIGMTAASPLTLLVMLVVIGLLLPVMLIYNAYQYWVFRGKVGEEGYGYEE